MELPPGLDVDTIYYVRTEKAGVTYWVSRYSCNSGWNISPYHAEPFTTLTEAKKMRRQLNRRKGWERTTFTVVAIDRVPDAYLVYPVQVLDVMARV